MAFSQFQKDGLSFLSRQNEKFLSKMIINANKQYYNNNPTLSDNEYDILKEYIERTYPNNKTIKQIGAPVERNKVELPYPMPSMDKIKPDTKALANWMKKYNGPYILSVKLDGVSGLYTTEGGEPKLYTRGNGSVGQDVSNLIPYLKLPSDKNVTIRGEFIMKKEVFDNKYKTTAANPRNLISGLINAKNVDKDKYNDIDFVAYEIMQPQMRPSAQMRTLESMNVENVYFENVSTISNDLLSDKLVSWRENYKYEMDGVIVVNNKIYERENKNPDHAFAFKMVLSDQIAEAKVIDVIWKPSKDGYIKPKVRIEPIHLGGVKIEYATAFNAAYIKKNKIGVGATIKLVRSGDVIPHILETITPASIVKMPELSYKWTKSKVDIVLKNPHENEVVQEKNITYFFTKLGIAGLSSGNVIRLMEAGYNTIPLIVSMKKDDYLDVEGFQEKMAQKLYTSIRNKIKSASLVDLMAASNIFGRGVGEKKIQVILNHYPDILISDENYEIKFNKLVEVESIAEKTAEYFLDHVDEFIDFIKTIKQQKKLIFTTTTYDESHALYNKNIVMTGFRSKELEDKIKSVGGNMSTSVSKNTFAVIIKDENSTSSKTEKALNLNIPVMTYKKFINEYLE